LTDKEDICREDKPPATCISQGNVDNVKTMSRGVLERRGGGKEEGAIEGMMVGRVRFSISRGGGLKKRSQCPMEGGRRQGRDVSESLSELSSKKLGGGM